MSITLNALVTAGANGIGLAIAEKLSSTGIKIHICDNDLISLERCKSNNPDYYFTHCNVSSYKDVVQLFQRHKKKFGNLDILVNNVGIAGPTKSIENIDVMEWENTINTNLNSHFYCIKESIALLKKSRFPNIICISSVAGRLGYADRTPYASSKWAIIGLVKSLAIELGKFGIKVNAVLPGFVSGERMQKVIADKAILYQKSYEDMESTYLQKVSLKKMVTKEDVAEAVYFLTSKHNTSITGQAISVCGGIVSL